MLKLSNLPIGVKLGVMSGISILMVAAMVGMQMMGNSAVRAAVDAAQRQNKVTQAALEAKASIRGMQIAVRDLRLARSPEDLQKAKEYLEDRLRAGTEFIDKGLQLAKSAENQDLLKKTRSLADQYDAASKELVQVKAEAIALDTKRDQVADAASRVSALNDQTFRIARERTLPLATTMEDAVNKVTANAITRSEAAVVEAQGEMSSAEHIGMISGGFVALILIGAAVLGVISIARPLKELTVPVGELAAGNFSVDVHGADRRDEVGQIAAAVASMAQRVRQTVSEIKSSAREVTNASAEISTSTTDLSQRTEEQAASLEETSASMEEISATVKKNAENAQQASQSANVTREVADRGGKVVAQAVEAMALIEESSRKISDIIGVIDEIARQTNLLALNAAVEAARAGEAGRGFAVVASEVRSLAQRSSQAAKDIKDLITNSNSQVKDGVDLVNRAGGALNEIVDSIKTVATIVSDIASASMEQATGIEQVNKALSQMDEVTQQNSALVEENAATAKTLQTQARSMDEQVAFFKVDDADQPEPIRKPEPVAARPAAAPHAPASGKVAVLTPSSKRPAPAAPKRVAAAARSPVGRMQASLATAYAEDPEWKEF
jgi:methyl-accepting chemotaxis protein